MLRTGPASTPACIQWAFTQALAVTPSRSNCHVCHVQDAVTAGHLKSATYQRLLLAIMVKDVLYLAAFFMVRAFPTTSCARLLTCWANAYLSMDFVATYLARSEQFSITWHRVVLWGLRQAGCSLNRPAASMCNPCLCLFSGE